MTEDFVSAFEQYLIENGDTFYVSGLALINLLKRYGASDEMIADFCKEVCGCDECRAQRLSEGMKA